MAKRKRKMYVKLSGSKEYHEAGLKRAAAEYESSSRQAQTHAREGNCPAAIRAFLGAYHALGRMDAHAAAAGKRTLETAKQRKMLVVAREAIRTSCSLDLR
jgi:hypothetical protein